MVPLTVCARRAAGLTHQHTAASARLTNLITRDLFLRTDFFSILFCRSGVIRLLWTDQLRNPWTVKLDHKEKSMSMGLGPWVMGLDRLTPYQNSSRKPNWI